MVVKVAWPEALVVPETTVIVEEPAPWASVTVWPASRWAKASLAVTVIVELAVPFASTELGAAATVELVASTAPAVKETVAVWVTVTVSVVSVAV